MQVVILAAGRSSRFIPFTSLVHKSMVKVMGKTILEHTLTSISKTGIREVILVVGENSSIPKVIGTGESFGLTIRYVIHIGAKGMGAALLEAQEYLHEKFFLLNAYHIDFDKFFDALCAQQQTDSTVVLLGKKPQSSIQFGVMEINGEKVTDVKEKPAKILDHQLQIIGIYLLNKNFLSVLSATPPDHYHFEKALDMYAKRNLVRFVKTSIATVSLKYAWDLLEIKNYLLRTMESYTSAHAKISPHSVITGNVFIEDDATIMEGAVIKGPVYVGKKAVIGNYAVVRGSVAIEENAIVGARMEIKNSLLMDGVTTHSGFLGDSIIGARTKIAAYVCTANARLDRNPVTTLVKEEKVSSGLTHLGTIIGKDANIGIRVSTMPGVIIGENSIIGPSTTVMKNIGDNTKYYTRFQEVIEENDK